MSKSKKVLLELNNLCKHYPIRKGLFSKVAAYVYAVDGVSFSIYEGETLGLVGESGCGKSTVGRTILLREKFFGAESVSMNSRAQRCGPSEKRFRQFFRILILL